VGPGCSFPFKILLSGAVSAKQLACVNLKWFFETGKTGAALTTACLLGHSRGTRVYSRATGALPWRRHWLIGRNLPSAIDKAHLVYNRLLLPLNP